MKKFILPYILLLSATQIMAQSVGGDRTEVIKNFKAVLDDSEKHEIPAAIPAEKDSQAPLQYNLESKLLSLSYDAPKLRPLAYKQKAVEKGYKFYSKLGMGFPMQPLAILSYHDKKEDFSYGVDFRHHSLNNNGADENQIVGQNSFDLMGKYDLSAFQIGGNLGYDFDRVHYYGYDDEAFSLDKADVQQTFKTIRGAFDIANIDENPLEIDYKGAIDFYNVSDDYDASETSIALNASAAKMFYQKHLAEVNFGGNALSHKTKNEKYNRPEYYFNPAVTFNTDFLSIRAGVNLEGDDEFHFFPDVALSGNLIENKLTAFAKWHGYQKKNNLYNSSTINPFVSPLNEFKNTSMEERRIGVKGGVSMVQFEISGAQIPVKNLQVYLEDTLSDVQFLTAYDDGSILNFNVSSTVTPNSSTKIYLNTDINSYKLDSLDAAFHLPNVEVNLGGSYSVTERLSTSAELFYGSPIKYLNTEKAETDKLNQLIDLSIGGQYKINKNFAAFAEVNNLLSSKRQRWENYSSVGLNFLAGIVVKY